MAHVEVCKMPFWNKSNTCIYYPQGRDIYHTLSPFLHPSHLSIHRNSFRATMIYIDCFYVGDIYLSPPMIQDTDLPLFHQIPGEEWGVHHMHTSASTDAELLSLMVPAMFKLFRAVVCCSSPVKLSEVGIAQRSSRSGVSLHRNQKLGPS